MKYFRHRRFDRLRYSRIFRKWLTTQATRLGMTPKQVFDTLLVGRGLSMEAVSNLPGGSVIPVTAVAISGLITGAPGAVIQFARSLTPTNATDTTGAWSSSNTAVMTVDQSGKGTLLSNAATGAVVNAVWTATNGVKGQLGVTVAAPSTVDPTAVTLNSNKTTGVVGDTFTLTSSVSPNTAAQDVTYSVADPTMASVDSAGNGVFLKSGIVVAMAAAKAKPAINSTKSLTSNRVALISLERIVWGSASIEQGMLLQNQGAGMTRRLLTEHGIGKASSPTTPLDSVNWGIGGRTIDVFNQWYTDTGKAQAANWAAGSTLILLNDIGNDITPTASRPYDTASTLKARQQALITRLQGDGFIVLLTATSFRNYTTNGVLCVDNEALGVLPFNTNVNEPLMSYWGDTPYDHEYNVGLNLTPLGIADGDVIHPNNLGYAALRNFRVGQVAAFIKGVKPYVMPRLYPMAKAPSMIRFVPETDGLTAPMVPGTKLLNSVGCWSSAQTDIAALAVKGFIISGITWSKPATGYFSPTAEAFGDNSDSLTNDVIRNAYLTFGNATDWTVFHSSKGWNAGQQVKFRWVSHRASTNAYKGLMSADGGVTSTAFDGAKAALVPIVLNELTATADSTGAISISGKALASNSMIINGWELEPA